MIGYGWFLWCMWYINIYTHIYIYNMCIYIYIYMINSLVYIVCIIISFLSFGCGWFLPTWWLFQPTPGRSSMNSHPRWFPSGFLSPKSGCHVWFAAVQGKSDSYLSEFGLCLHLSCWAFMGFLGHLKKFCHWKSSNRCHLRIVWSQGTRVCAS